MASKQVLIEALFLQPYTGNQGYVDLYRNLVGREYRVVHQYDIVPSIPPVSSYRHVGLGIWELDGQVFLLMVLLLLIIGRSVENIRCDLFFTRASHFFMCFNSRLKEIFKPGFLVPPRHISKHLVQSYPNHGHLHMERQS